ncbi:beta-glucuronidase LacZ4 [Ferrimonas pelagia]|uniref:Glycoside hydrolase family 2 TIM barrel-domain containing protein n=1 Tax=Ferrimonas pelagia TaxID=1177826 RepID=A0ABP9EJA3_9GAMM
MKQLVRSILLTTMLAGITAPALAERHTRVINDQWQFRYGYDVTGHGAAKVQLPHTWNQKDALGGNWDYYRGIGNYERKLIAPQSWQDKRVVLRFLGVNTVSNLFVNGKHVGEHRGGYSAFAFDISDYLIWDQENTLQMRVNNAAQLDVMPLVGDFNMYGGIYRDVKLIVTEQDSISLLDYGSKGVYLFQDSVSAERAEIRARVLTLGAQDKQLRLTVEDAEGQAVLRREIDVAGGEQQSELRFALDQPRLWQGQKDPYLYRVRVEVLHNQRVLDTVTQPLGLRSVRFDPQQGFFLNGERLKLRGVNRHQDRPELGNALSRHHHREDLDIIEEMGANAVRLSHYPHDPYVYEELDRRGLLAWSEIPFVGPGGYLDKGFVDSDSFKTNGREQLIAMIRQNLNHPSVILWGIFNELKQQGDDPLAYVGELQALARAEDPTRATAAASNQSGSPLDRITDVMAWNKYDGWYGGAPETIAQWADRTHQAFADTPIGISEYGAGASLWHQQQALERPKPVSYWHPENWQTHYHEIYWPVIDQRDFLWGTFVWNMFDFGAAHRTEGEVNGKNDKGLVSFDRKERKDAFFFYQANWSSEPMLHIAEKRFERREQAAQRIKVYSNEGAVTLHLNGEVVGHSEAADYGRHYFDVQLKPGRNQLEVHSAGDLTDQLMIQFEPAAAL